MRPVQSLIQPRGGFPRQQEKIMQLNDPDLLRHQAYIDGQWCDASNGDVTEIFNPANGEW